MSVLDQKNISTLVLFCPFCSFISFVQSMHFSEENQFSWSTFTVLVIFLFSTPYPTHTHKQAPQKYIHQLPRVWEIHETLLWLWYGSHQAG